MIDKKHLDPYYTKQMASLGQPSFSLYSSKISHTVRLNRIFDAINLENRALLDVGCGVAQFYDECQNRGIQLSNYVGTEPMSQVYEGAKKVHPELDIRLIDIVDEDAKDIGKFDVIIGISIAAVKIGDTERSDHYWKTWIEKAFELLNDDGVLAINFFSTFKTDIRPEDYVVDPVECFSFCKRLTERVMLDHSYMPQDFFVFLYKGDSQWKKEWKKRQ